MKALILAGGLGSRLKYLTKDKPKCLVEVNGKPMLEYQLDALKANGIKDIIIATGYLGKKIEEFVKQDKFKDFNFTLVRKQKIGKGTNSGYSFWVAKDHLKDTSYIHLNCDTLFDGGLIKDLLNNQHENVLTLNYKVKLAPRHCEQVILDEDRIVKMDSTAFPGSVAKAVGIAKLSPDLVEWIVNQMSYYLEVEKLETKPFYSYIRQALWHIDIYGMDAGNHKLCDINTEEQLREAEQLMSDD